MPATVSGSMTVTRDASPALDATALTALMAIAPENLTMAQLKQIQDACNRQGAAQDATVTVKTLLT